MTSDDIINRAIGLLESGPLDEDWCGRGLFCPRCALATATTAIQEEEGLRFDALDGWLRVACHQVGEIPAEPMTQEKSIALLRRAVSD